MIAIVIRLYPTIPLFDVVVLDVGNAMDGAVPVNVIHHFVFSATVSFQSTGTRHRRRVKFGSSGMVVVLATGRTDGSYQWKWRKRQQSIRHEPIWTARPSISNRIRLLRHLLPMDSPKCHFDASNATLFAPFDYNGDGQCIMGLSILWQSQRIVSLSWTYFDDVLANAAGQRSRQTAATVAGQCRYQWRVVDCAGASWMPLRLCLCQYLPKRPSVLPV